MCVLQFLLDNIFSLIGAIAATFAAIFIGLSWRATKKTWETAEKTFQYRIFGEIQMEYRNKEMGASISALYDLYERSEKRISNLKSLYSLDSIIHFHRRRVSHFYQRLGWLYSIKILDIKMILSYWTEGDLRIIPDILIPIETIVLPEAIGKKRIISKDYSESFKNMLKLYEAAKAMSTPI